MTVSVVQLSAEFETVDEMLQKVERLLEAEKNERDLLVLPELWLSGYFNFDRYVADAMTIDDARARLGRLARMAESAVVCGSFVERLPDGGLANTSLLLDDDGSLRLSYRKTHLFPLESQEPKLLIAGNEYRVASIGSTCIGILICYDLRFPEAARTLVQAGADVLVVPAAWPAARIDHWKLLLQARAVENQVFVVGCNAPNRGGEFELGGRSLVVSPSGEIVAEGPVGEGVVKGELNLEEIAAARIRYDTTGRTAEAARAGA